MLRATSAALSLRNGVRFNARRALSTAAAEPAADGEYDLVVVGAGPGT